MKNLNCAGCQEPRFSKTITLNSEKLNKADRHVKFIDWISCGLLMIQKTWKI